MSFIVLMAEILTIVLLHAVKLNQQVNTNKELSSHSALRQPEFHLKQSFSTSSYLK